MLYLRRERFIKFIVDSPKAGHNLWFHAGQKKETRNEEREIFKIKNISNIEQCSKDIIVPYVLIANGYSVCYPFLTIVSVHSE